MAKDASIGVNLIGRDVSASKALKDVGNAADKVGRKMVDVSDKIIKGMAMAATATALAAVKIGYDAVNAAIEDQKSVDLLAQSIRKATGASVEQTKAVEDYITSQQKRLGMDDGALRSSLGTLVRATGSVTKAQKLQNDALNISAMTGKDVQTVSLSLAKAYTGNYGALSRMGVSIDKTALKSKDFNKIMENLRRVSKGFADREANTLEGKMRKIKVAFDEAKESLGYQLMPYVTEFAEYVSTTLVPNIQAWLDANGPQFRKMIEETIPKAQAFLDKLREIGTWAIEHKDVLWTVAKVITSIAVGIKAAAVASTIIGGLKTLIGVYQALTAASATATVAQAAASGGVSIAFAAAGMAGAVAALAAYGIMSGSLGGEKGVDPSVKSPDSAKFPLNRKLMIGEQGVIPNRISNTGGNTYIFNVPGLVTEDKTLRIIRDGLVQLNKRVGRGD